MLFAHQTLVHRQMYFDADGERCGEQQIERAADRAIGRVLHRDYAMADLPGFDLAKYLVNGSTRLGTDLTAEVLDRCLFAEGARRTQKRNRLRLLERTTRGDDLDEQVADRLRG